MVIANLWSRDLLFVRSKYTSIYVKLLELKSSVEDRVNKVIGSEGPL